MDNVDCEKDEGDKEHAHVWNYNTVMFQEMMEMRVNNGDCEKDHLDLPADPEPAPLHHCPPDHDDTIQAPPHCADVPSIPASAPGPLMSYDIYERPLENDDYKKDNCVCLCLCMG